MKCLCVRTACLTLILCAFGVCHKFVIAVQLAFHLCHALVAWLISSFQQSDFPLLRCLAGCAAAEYSAVIALVYEWVSVRVIGGQVSTLYLSNHDHHHREHNS